MHPQVVQGSFGPELSDRQFEEFLAQVHAPRIRVNSRLNDPRNRVLLPAGCGYRHQRRRKVAGSLQHKYARGHRIVRGERLTQLNAGLFGEGRGAVVRLHCGGKVIEPRQELVTEHGLSERDRFGGELLWCHVRLLSAVPSVFNSIGFLCGLVTVEGCITLR